MADLFEPNPLIYWPDFLFHVALGWTAFALAVVRGGWLGLLLTVVAAGALYRAIVFTHELVHLGRGKLPGFRAAWDILCGIPLLAPSFLYDGVHQEHHFRHHYGTPEDGEYLPFGHPPRWTIPVYLASHVLIPFVAVVRFALIGPLSWMWPAARPMVLARMSSLSIDPRYVRKVPESIPASWKIQEAACAVFLWGVAAALWLKWLPLRVVWVWYLALALILVFNGIRTLAAHRYANRSGTMTREEQLLDSVNIAGGSALTPVLAPVGLRYHGLHHLFPTMPYHRLGAAHRRLMQVLPPDAPYRATVERSFSAALSDLWRRSGGKGPRPRINESG
ncbi:MAG: fatty acid desaturase [Arenicellales bacterium]